MLGGLLWDPLFWFMLLPISAVLIVAAGFIYGLYNVARGNDLPNQDDIDKIRNESE